MKEHIETKEAQRKSCHVREKCRDLLIAEVWGFMIFTRNKEEEQDSIEYGRSE